MSCIQTLPLCSTPVIATREGHTGANAYLNRIGLGIWYASGQQYSFPNSMIPQPRNRTSVGTSKPDTFTKGFNSPSYGSCPV